MHNLEDILARSFSSSEIVVSYHDALELLYIYQLRGTQVLGWEGWIRYPNGVLGHSQRYQGTADLRNMPQSSALNLIKSTIMQAYQEWQEKPEADLSELLFCITTKS